MQECSSKCAKLKDYQMVAKLYKKLMGSPYKKNMVIPSLATS